MRIYRDANGCLDEVAYLDCFSGILLTIYEQCPSVGPLLLADCLGASSPC